MKLIFMVLYKGQQPFYDTAIMRVSHITKHHAEGVFNLNHAVRVSVAYETESYRI